MKTSLRLASLLFAAAAAVPAQTYGSAVPAPLLIGLSDSATVPLEFKANWPVMDNRNYASLKITATAGGACMVLVHVVPDPRHPSHAPLLAAWGTLYPWLGLPNPNWTLDSVSKLQNPVTPANWHFEDDRWSPLVIPPVRLRDAVHALVNGSYVYNQHGAVFTSAQVDAVLSMPSTVQSSIVADERHYHASWINPNRDSFSTASLTGRAFEVATHKYYTTITPQQQAQLQMLIDQSFGWSVQVQMFQVIQGSGGPRIKASKPGLWKRRTVGPQGDDAWFEAIGPRLELPLLPSDQMVSIGMPTKFTEVTLQTPTSSSNIFAHIPLSSGGWATVPRVLTVGTYNAASNFPARALFTLPANAISGTCYLSTSPQVAPAEWIATKVPAIGAAYDPASGQPVVFQEASFNLMVVP